MIAATKKKKYLLGRVFTLRTDHRELQYLLSQGESKQTPSRLEIRREKLACFNYKTEFNSGENNQLADWLSRSSTKIDHKESPLKEEYVINEVESRITDNPLYYSEKMKALVQVIKAEQ